jgi:hypothetical protein
MTEITGKTAGSVIWSVAEKRGYADLRERAQARR